MVYEELCCAASAAADLKDLNDSGTAAIAVAATVCLEGAGEEIGQKTGRSLTHWCCLIDIGHDSAVGPVCEKKCAVGLPYLSSIPPGQSP